MRASQSSPKLAASQKNTLNNWKQRVPDVKLFSFPDRGVTVAIRRTGPVMGEFSVAVAGECETKFRRKVGQYWAMWRFVGGQVLPVKLGAAYEGDDLEGFAREIAYAVGG